MVCRSPLYVQIIVIIICVCFPFNAYSAILKCIVKDNKGKPVTDAVVSATLITSDLTEITRSKTQIIDQVDKEFVRYVTPVMVGTKISFPNHDKIRHHVYSFSEANTFEIPLYPPDTVPQEPVVFDKPGIAVLGCNIHDWMKAYVCVVETPFFATTDANGIASITDLPPGKFDAQVWHPRIKKSSQNIKQQVTIIEDNHEEAEFTIKLEREFRPMRAPKLSGDVYR